MDNNELQANLDRTKTNLLKCMGNDKKSEAEHGNAYQAMVRAGLRLQIKKKYR